MAFPDLFPVAGNLMTAKAIGVPDNGNETFGIPWVPFMGMDPAQIDEENLELTVVQSTLAPGVTSARLVSLAADKSSITVDFTQTVPGTGRCMVICSLKHSLPR